MRKFACLGLIGSLLLLTVHAVYSQADVLTQHNNLQRTGWNSQETRLNTKNVKAGPFAKLFTYGVDDQLYAQPLVVSAVNIPGIGLRNLVYVATVNNTVYAFDADSGRVAGPYWKVNLSPAGTRPPKNTDMTGACGGNGNYRDFSGNIGIVGTPVIDKTSQTIYLVSRSVTTDGTNVFSQYLHALDITTGAERAGSPVQITAQVNGHGDGNVNGVITFDSQRQNQRPGLLLLNGTVYIGYSSHCDWTPYHGWLLGYDATTLQQKIVYNDTPEGTEGGIWMSGSAPSVDEAGNIYVSTGNGTVGMGSNYSNLTNRSESLLKLAPSGNALTLSDFFTPSNFQVLEASDLDFGATEVLLIPNSSLALTGCKDGHLYIVDLNNLGGFNASTDKNLQTINLGPSAHLRTSLGYYQGSTHEFVYVWSENTALRAYPINRPASKLDTINKVTSGIQGPSGNNGAQLASSSNGAVDSTGILWVSHAVNGCDANQSVCTGILRAINANDVTQELWNSQLNPNDNIGKYAKFSCPTVVNGKVYMASFSNQLVVYGLTNNGFDTCNSMNVALNKTATVSSVRSPSNPASAAFDGNPATSWASNSTGGEYIYVDLGAKYDLCRIVLNWAINPAIEFYIFVSDDASNWTILQHITTNSQAAMVNTINLHGSGRYVMMRGVTPGPSGYYSINEMALYGTPFVTCAAPANLSTGNISTNSVTVGWRAVGNATGYSVQYKTVADASWITVSSNTNSVALQALSCGTDYLFQVAAICSSSQQSVYSTSSAFSTASCTNNCAPLPTRWTTSDIGNVGIAGTACYNGGAYSLQGSGSDIGGNTDAFRFAYFTMVTDDQVIARVLSQDATDPDNKTGIMVREDFSPDARNAFISLTSGQGAVFQYRSATGGGTYGSFASGLAAPYWVKLAKTGSTYSGYTSPDGLTWTQLGAAADLGFGANGSATYAGFAITSHDNTVLSTAAADNFMQLTSPLAIRLVSFTARSINDQYIGLAWATASEENNDHFEVERSQDGRHFRTVLTLKAVGNSSSRQEYTAEDREPGAGVNYYRLKQVDVDGRFTYSPVILVRFGKQAAAPLLFPNPANSFFTILSGQESIKEVGLYDVSGRNISRLLNGAGSSTLVISCAGLPAGIYIVRIRTGTQYFLQKLIKR